MELAMAATLSGCGEVSSAATSARLFVSTLIRSPTASRCRGARFFPVGFHLLHSDGSGKAPEDPAFINRKRQRHFHLPGPATCCLCRRTMRSAATQPIAIPRRHLAAATIGTTASLGRWGNHRLERDRCFSGLFHAALNFPIASSIMINCCQSILLIGRSSSSISKFCLPFEDSCSVPLHLVAAQFSLNLLC